jgi:hypothetical protein
VPFVILAKVDAQHFGLSFEFHIRASCRRSVFS